MIKLIIFDLDGVLIDTPDMHYETFSKAYCAHTNVIISKKEHDVEFNGRSTRAKLELLKQRDNLSDQTCNLIWREKQKLTEEYIQNKVGVDQNKIQLLQTLKSSGYFIACASNAIRETVRTILDKLGIYEYFDLILSNEDVRHPKPSTEIYLKAMMHFNCSPSNTLIVEDSWLGFEGATATRADVLRVVNSKDVTLNKISQKLQQSNSTIMNQQYENKNITVVIPMAGAGSRFEKAGYTFPKPLIDVNGKTMISTVIESLNLNAKYVFIVRSEHDQKYSISDYLKTIVPDCEIVSTDGLTEGAACTVLLAKEHINNDNPILIANSDQYIEWDVFEFIKSIDSHSLDGSILTFYSTHPKWSFAKLNDEGLVTEVAEKKPISSIATVGIYWWTKGSDFVKYAEQMIQQNIRVNGEFYVCPVYNEAIKSNLRIGVYNVAEMWGLGTPEDLQYFLNNGKAQTK